MWLGRPRQLLLPINQAASFDAHNIAEMLFPNLKSFKFLVPIAVRIVDPRCNSSDRMVQTSSDYQFIDLQLSHVGGNCSSQVVFVPKLHVLENAFGQIPTDESSDNFSFNRPVF